MSISQKGIIIVSKKTNGHCFYCGTKNAYQIDHFFPTALHKLWGNEGYTDNNSLDNLFLACSKCNQSKGAKHPEDFLGGNFKAWSRFFRANYRVGLSEFRNYL